MSNENKVLGAVGAVIGAVLGIIVWCLIGKLGYISWIGGFAISVFTLGGYLVLGKDVSKFGVILSVALMIVSVYVATRLNWAIAFKDALEEEIGATSKIGLWDCFKDITGWIELAGETASFYVDLGLVSYYCCCRLWICSEKNYRQMITVCLRIRFNQRNQL